MGLPGLTEAGQVEASNLLMARVVLTVWKMKTTGEPGQQWSWKITLTILCAIVGAVAALYVFRVL